MENNKFYEKMIYKYEGKKFGRLTVLKVLELTKECKKRKGLLKCDCGVEKVGVLHGLGTNTKSCGCLNLEIKKNNHFKNSNISCKYEYNIDLFKTLTPESLYFLGYLFSDGCLSSSSNAIQISSADKEILIKLNKLISADNIVRQISEKKNNKQAYYLLQITNKEIYQDLLNLGLYPNKSLNLTIPEYLSDSKDFWRGMIDGDGTMGVYNKQFTLGIAGTYSVCESFIKFCNKYISSNRKIHINSKSGKNFATGLNGTKALIIHKALYENSSIYMERKQKFSNLYHLINEESLLRPFKVKQLDLEGNLIKIWDSVQIAAKTLNIRKENIQSVLGNQPPLVCNNFKWEYAHRENLKYKKEKVITNIWNNKTGFKGVTKLNNTYSVTITYNEKKYVFYDFKTSEEAAKFYDRLCWKYLKKEYLLNFKYDKYSDIEDVDIDIKKPSSKEHLKSPSKFIGKSGKNFTVIVPVNGKTTYYGSFKTVEQAVVKRDEVLELLKNNKFVKNYGKNLN